MTSKAILEEIQLHIKRVEAILPDIKGWLPLKADDFDDIEKIKTIDSFVYRFIKIQDKMGQKLFPEVLKKLLEYEDNMSLLDMLNKLEKLGILPNAEMWIDYRNLRNILTHEYPDNYSEVAKAISEAIIAYEQIVSIFKKMAEIVNKNEK